MGQGNRGETVVVCGVGGVGGVVATGINKGHVQITTLVCVCAAMLQTRPSVRHTMVMCKAVCVGNCNAGARGVKSPTVCVCGMCGNGMVREGWGWGWGGPCPNHGIERHNGGTWKSKGNRWGNVCKVGAGQSQVPVGRRGSPVQIHNKGRG